MLALRAPLVLASRSPRRRDLLDRLGVVHAVCPADADETWPDGEAPGPAVEAIARRKTDAVASSNGEALTLGADTVVVLDGEVLGKPADANEAQSMLARLSGRTHTVYTGLALAHPPSTRAVATHEATQVTFAPLVASEIEP